jgi:hypothetical protein
VIASTQGSVTINFSGGCDGLSSDQLDKLIDQSKPLLTAPPYLQERVEKLVAQSSLTTAALTTFFRSVGEQGEVAPEDLDNKMRQWTAKYHAMEAQVAALPQGSLKREADDALKAGAYDRAQALVTLAQDQVRAVNLIEENQVDQALALLNDIERRLNEMSDQATSADHLQRGYDFKTYAEAFDAKGRKDEVDHYLKLARSEFESVKGESANTVASAINGIGNVSDLGGRIARPLLTTD